MISTNFNREVAECILRRRWDYFVEHLLGAKHPKEYKIKFERDLRMN